MAYYVGLDVSQKQTWICVVDEKGQIAAQGGAFTRAEDIYGWLGNRIEHAQIVRVGLEAGNMSSWLYSGLTKLGLTVVCLEAFQAHRFLAAQRNKTDKNDARGLAQLTRMGEGFLKLAVAVQVAFLVFAAYFLFSLSKFVPQPVRRQVLPRGPPYKR